MDTVTVVTVLENGGIMEDMRNEPVFGPPLSMKIDKKESFKRVKYVGTWLKNRCAQKFVILMGNVNGREDQTFESGEGN